jgi:hypothetical protein
MAREQHPSESLRNLAVRGLLNAHHEKLFFLVSVRRGVRQFEQRLGRLRWRTSSHRRSPGGRRRTAHARELSERRVRLFERRMRRKMRGAGVRRLRVHAAVSHGLLGRKLRARVPEQGLVHARLLVGPLPHVLRQRRVRRELLGGLLQHVVPGGRQLHGCVLGRTLRDGVRRRSEMLVQQLLGRRVHVHGSGLLITRRGSTSRTRAHL